MDDITTTPLPGTPPDHPSMMVRVMSVRANETGHAGCSIRPGDRITIGHAMLHDNAQFQREKQ